MSRTGALVCLAASVLACGTRAGDRGTEWLGDTHARAPGSSHGEAATEALSAHQARQRLDGAAAAGAGADVVRYADAFVRAGGTLTDPDRRAVVAAADELRAHELPELYRSLMGADDDRPHTLSTWVMAARMALISTHAGDREAARTWLARLPVESDDAMGLVADRLAAGAVARVRDMRAQLSRERADSPVDGRVVAVLLPLSGRFARLGNALRTAIEFANEVDQRRTKLVFLDTLGTGQGARAAVGQAVSAHRALAILGPVGERESLSAAGRAAELGIPIGLLSPGEAGGAGAGVFRLWSSPEWEAREAARLAMDAGYDRLAVLSPRDEHGRAATQAFADTARQRGLQLIRTGTYDPSVADLEADAKAFLGLDPRTNARLRKHLRRSGYKRGWQTFSPDIDFDLLYIPDDYQRAALMVAFLPYFNVEVRTQDAMDIAYLKRKHRGRIPQVVQLLGSSGWHHASLIPRGGSAVEGALVVEVYSGSEVEEYSSEEAARFAEAFETFTGRQPSSLSAQAYDAATLVLQARARAAQAGARAATLRAQMSRELSRGQLSDGACGPARVNQFGGLDRRATLLRVDGGTFVLHEY